MPQINFDPATPLLYPARAKVRSQKIGSVLKKRICREILTALRIAGSPGMNIEPIVSYVLTCETTAAADSIYSELAYLKSAKLLEIRADESLRYFATLTGQGLEVARYELPMA